VGGRESGQAVVTGDLGRVLRASRMRAVAFAKVWNT